MDLITLIGDIDENFYQLGLRDKETGKHVHHDVKSMLRTPWQPVNILIEEVAKAVLKNSLLKKTDNFTHLKAYSDGMGVPLEQVVYMMLVPEMVSSLSKWAPGFIKGSFGCSSFMMRNNAGEVVHGRILDFPLQGSYDKFERAIMYDLKGVPKTLGFGTQGIPYPSITLMTEDGITIALHQKFTNNFNPQGLSIFAFIFKMIQVARDKKSIIEFVKNHQTITTWCLYMTFQDGNALALDLNGSNTFVNELDIPDTGILYFCNHLEDKSINQRQFLPLGFDQYNLMREEIATKKILNHFKKKNEQPDDLTLLQLMAKPLDQKLKPSEFNKFALDNITPTSLSVMTMNTAAQKALYIEGPAPKLFRNDVVLFSGVFERIKQDQCKIKKGSEVDPEYQEGLSALAQAQKGFDSHNPVDVYHCLQMAIDHLDEYPEKNIARFYFLIAQYIYETHPNILANLLTQFKEFEGKLPVYLNDHCLLFIGRLERILKMSPSLEEDKIETLKLREIYSLETKIPRPLFHISTKKMIIPRIDILDIIYLYTK
jgi:hypothetical protein